MTRIGPTFAEELRTAGLTGLPFSWGDDGVIQYDPRMTPAQIAAVQAVYAAHDPTAPSIQVPDMTVEDLQAALIAKGVLTKADVAAAMSATEATKG